MKFRPIVVLVVATCLLDLLGAASVVSAEPSVNNIQKALADKGFKLGVPDGVWGKMLVSTRN